ncbi:MAG: SWIM zinc finger family protein [Deltaproteobacteria bacterium]|nr:SWIM zinc finger family protein [Deltaproteobacteria bacterium]
MDQGPGDATEGTPTPLPRFGESQVRALVGARNLERGRAYLRWGAVYDGRRQGRALKARCEGSGEETWRVRVECDVRAITLAHCTCPAAEAGPCKHAAAVLLAWLSSPEDFAEVEPSERALARRSREELLSFCLEVLRRRPELEPLFETLLATPRGEGTGWSARAARVFRRRGAGAEALAGDLGVLLDEAQSAPGTDSGALLEAASAVASAVLGRWPRCAHAALGAVVDRCAEALQNVAGAVPAARPEALWRLVELYRFDVEAGRATGAASARGPARRALTALREEGTAEERAALGRRVQALADEAEPWLARGWAALRAELEDDTLDEASWRALHAQTGRALPVARRLLAEGRGEEALALARGVQNHELLAVAELLVSSGLAREAEALVGERASRGAHPAQLAWLRARADRSEPVRAVELLELVLRAKPERAALDAVQSQARVAGAWAEVRPRVQALLTERALALLAEWLLDEGDLPGAVLAASHARFPGAQHGPVRLRVAEAAEARHPAWAQALYARHAEAVARGRGRANYREALRALDKVRALEARSGDLTALRTALGALEAQHGKAAAFREELDAWRQGRAA